MNNYPMPGPGMNGMPNNHLVPQQQPPNLPPQQPQQPHPPTTGLGVAALVLGIIALATSFIPIVNNLSFLIALVGLVLGIVGVVACNRGRKSGKGIAVGGVILCALSLVAVMVAQSSSFTTAFNESYSAAISRSASASSSSAASSGSSATASASNAPVDAKYTVSIDECMLSKDYHGQDIAVVTFTFTNNSDKDTSFYVATYNRAFQNGVQLDSAVGENVDSNAQMKDVKPGATITVQKGYALTDMSPLTVEVEEDTFLSDIMLAEKTFTLQ